MGADQHIDWTREQAAALASTLDWWRDAGVDTLVEDEPRDWLAAVAPPAAVSTTARAIASAPLPAALPTTLEAFLAWRIGEDAPEAAWPGATIAASGPITADLMILVDCPERDDRDLLLSGPAGRLFERMLAAIGRSRADVHLAAVCARRPVAGRTPRDAEARLAGIARHHTALAAPKRLLVMGKAASRAILGIDTTEARGSLRVVNHEGGTRTEVVASFHPRFLLEKPAAKAEAWKDLQMLIGGLS